MVDLMKMVRNSAPSFRFMVQVNGIPFGVFTECTLPSIEWETEEVKEGGLNTYTHQLPGRRKSTTVTLRNGVGLSPFMEWYLKSMDGTIIRRAVIITLFSSLRAPVMVLQISDAYPVKWEGPQLKSDDTNIAVQSLELACGSVQLIPHAGGFTQ